MARIGIVHPSLGLGGAERLIVDAALELRAVGHEVTIFTTQFDPRRCFPELLGGEVGVEVHGGRVPKRIGPGLIAPLAIAATSRAARAAAARRLDVVICDLLPHVAPQLVESGVPVVYYCHHPDAYLVPKGTLWRRVYRQPIDALERRGIARAERILVNSAFTAGALERFMRGRLHVRPRVVYPGVDPVPYAAIAELDAEDAGGDIVIASINRFDERKDLHLGLEAFAMLLAMVPRALASRLRCVVAGGHDPNDVHSRRSWSRLVALRHGLGLGERIDLLQNIDERARLSLLERCRAVVYTPSHEHFGYGVVEAMMAARPVVACNSGGPREILRDGSSGWLCEASASALARGLERAITCTATAARVGRQGRLEARERFARSRFGDEVRSVVDEVLASPRTAVRPTGWFVPFSARRSRARAAGRRRR